MAQCYNFNVDDYLACCGSSKFASEMAKLSPFFSLSEAVDASRSIWWTKVDIPGWLEAFAAHPRIGDVGALTRSSSTAEWSKGEQSMALSSTNDAITQELAEWNWQYESKFGFTFLICASGKSSSEIIANLKVRFLGRPIDELQLAAAEQQKITEIRLGKLFTERGSVSSAPVSELSVSAAPLSNNPDSQVVQDGQIGANLLNADIKDKPDSSLIVLSSTRPPITTHVLDVSLGRPGAGIDVVLEFWNGSSKVDEFGKWVNIGSSVTNIDGRSGPLLPPSSSVSAGRYKLTFETGKYFLKLSSSGDTPDTSGCFYPYVSIIFEIKPSQVLEHFHIPVLLSPFSYTTYRGS